MEFDSSKEKNAIKVIFVGESHTGKTSLINNLYNIPINPFQTSTSIPNQQSYKLKLDSFANGVPLSLWDTAGQEKFRSLNKLFFKDAKIAIIVIDITSRSTFTAVEEFWFKYIKEICGEECVIGIAENKVDLFQHEQVTESEVEEYIKDKNIISQRTSACTGVGIEDLLKKLVERYLHLVETKAIPNTLDFLKNISLKQNPSRIEKKKKEKCCN